MKQDDNRTSDLIVFGAGQMRTGTASLKKALEYLYGGKCYHMEEVLDNPSHIELWTKAVKERRLTKEAAVKLFQGYVAAVDNPAAAFYKDIGTIYPNTKIILSIRDPDSWLRSVRQTTMQPLSIFKRLILYMTGFNDAMVMCDSVHEMSLKRSKKELMNDEILKHSYINFNEEVKQFIGEGRLLVFQAREGWGPLCRFLGKDIPNIPYPNVNSSEEFNNILELRIKYQYSRFLIHFFVLAAIAVVICLILK